MRAALKALIVANECLESEVSELMRVVSRAYVRGRFKTYAKRILTIQIRITFGWIEGDAIDVDLEDYH